MVGRCVRRGMTSITFFPQPPPLNGLARHTRFPGRTRSPGRIRNRSWRSGVNYVPVATRSVSPVSALRRFHVVAVGSKTSLNMYIELVVTSGGTLTVPGSPGPVVPGLVYESLKWFQPTTTGAMGYTLSYSFVFLHSCLVWGKSW